MAMTYGKYRSNVMKTLGTKAAKLGLRTVAKNTLHTNQVRSLVGLALATDGLIQVLNPYILGEQLHPKNKEDAANQLSQVGYHLTILTRLFKMKTPSATKKIKMTGTLTANILTLHGIASNMLHYVDGVLVGPDMHEITKEIVMPKTGEKEMRKVMIINEESEEANETERQKQLHLMLTAFVEQFWKVALGVTGSGPAPLFEAHQKVLDMHYPGAFEEKPKQVAVPA